VASDVLFYTKAQFRLRLIPELSNSACAGSKDGHYPAQLETDARCIFEEERNGGPYPCTNAKPERSTVLVLCELICQGFRWKEIFGLGIEATSSVRVQVQRRREEQMNVFGDTSGHHHLQVVGVILLKVVVTFDARVG
jgi:hypothetical protein